MMKWANIRITASIRTVIKWSSVMNLCLWTFMLSARQSGSVNRLRFLVMWGCRKVRNDKSPRGKNKLFKTDIEYNNFPALIDFIFLEKYIQYAIAFPWTRWYQSCLSYTNNHFHVILERQTDLFRVYTKFNFLFSLVSVFLPSSEDRH